MAVAWWSGEPDPTSKARVQHVRDDCCKEITSNYPRIAYSSLIFLIEQFTIFACNKKCTLHCVVHVVKAGRVKHDATDAMRRLSSKKRMRT